MAGVDGSIVAAAPSGAKEKHRAAGAKRRSSSSPGARATGAPAAAKKKHRRLSDLEVLERDVIACVRVITRELATMNRKEARMKYSPRP